MSKSVLVMDKVKQIVLLLLTTFSVGKLNNWLLHIFLNIFSF